MQQKTQEFTIDDFSGGQVSVGSPFNLPEETSPACINVYADRFGSLKRRKGITKINATAAAQATTAYGLFDYEVSATVRKQIAQVGTVLYKMDALDGTFDSLKTGMTATRFHAVNFSNTLLLTNGTDTVQSWDGSAASTSDLAAAPKGTRMAVWHNYVWMIGQDANNIRYSNAADHTTWDAGDTWGIYSYRGDKIYGLALLRRYMFAFKKYGIFRISYLGGSPLLDVQQIDADVGCNTPETIKNVNWGGKKGLMYLGSDKVVYFFDGYNSPTPLSSPIEFDNNEAPVTMAKIHSDFDRAHAINYPDENWYALYLPLRSTGVNNDVAICFDYSKQPMSIWAFDNMNASISSVIVDTDGDQRAMFMDYSGFLQEMQKGNTDNGTTISAGWSSKHTARSSKTTLKKERTAKVVAKAIGNYNLSLKYRPDWDTSWASKTVSQRGTGYYLGSTFILGTATLGGTNTVTVDKNIPVLNNHIQYRIESTTDQPSFNLYSLSSLYQEEGIGSS